MAFGDLVASWQGRFKGEPITVVVERLPDAVRMVVRNSERQLTSDEWSELVSPALADLTFGWGIDRRLPGRAWFEFR